jgi:hypothetical protein
LTFPEAAGRDRLIGVGSTRWPSPPTSRARPGPQVVADGSEFAGVKRTFAGCAKIGLNESSDQVREGCVTSLPNFRGAKTYSRTCPNCYQPIDLELALRLSSWSKSAPSNCGVRCPKCKIILAARQRGGFGAFWVVLAVAFATIMIGQTTRRLSRTSVLLIELALVVLALFMQRWRLRSLIELSLPPPGVELREVHPSAKDYAYLEGRNGRDQELRFDPAMTEDLRPEWICANCEQSNPASFDFSWKCNHRQLGRTK